MESAITVKGVRANGSCTLTFDQKALRLPGFERRGFTSWVLHRSNDGSAGLFAVLLPLHSYDCQPIVTRLLSFLFLPEIPRSCPPTAA